MHRIGVYLTAGFQLLDLAGPLDVFQAANAAAGTTLYDWRFLSRTGGVVAGMTGVSIVTERAADGDLATLLVAGGEMAALLRPEEIDVIRRLADGASRIAAVCIAAFALADAGLLDGRRATTHWSWAAELQRRRPAAIVDADRIFVADGPVWTSAGVSAGIDLALALVEVDHGVELAREVARELVVYHRRPGGQSQFSTLARLDPASDRVRAALAFARERLDEPLPLGRLARAANLSPRQFERVFRRETGETPARAIERLRVEVARERLQDGLEPVEAIAR